MAFSSGFSFGQNKSSSNLFGNTNNNSNSGGLFGNKTPTSNLFGGNNNNNSSFSFGNNNNQNQNSGFSFGNNNNGLNFKKFSIFSVSLTIDRCRKNENLKNPNL